MSLAGIQETLVKTHLVQQVQSRGTEQTRAQEQAQTQFHRDLAREADEVVLSMTRAEESAINENDEDREKGEGRRRRRNRPDEEEAEPEGGETAPPSRLAPPLGPPPPPDVGSRRIDFFM